ncbi:hypothetical protein PMAN_a2820 [Pseudoalteromonas marina]|nr:hypothetical protein PMAN_a2820 [Pseudoalteromonas marina]
MWLVRLPPKFLIWVTTANQFKNFNQIHTSLFSDIPYISAI